MKTFIKFFKVVGILFIVFELLAALLVLTGVYSKGLFLLVFLVFTGILSFGWIIYLLISFLSS